MLAGVAICLLAASALAAEPTKPTKAGAQSGKCCPIAYRFTASVKQHDASAAYAVVAESQLSPITSLFVLSFLSLPSTTTAEPSKMHPYQG